LYILANDGKVAPFVLPPKGEPPETVDGPMDFLRGFGAMFALIVVFATIGFIKYKVMIIVVIS
jgi:hypothetical protein